MTEMIDWEKLKLTKIEAKKVFDELDESNLVHGSLKKEDSKVREELLKYISVEEDIKNLYSFDLEFALVLYRVLNDKFQFNERLAAQDDIWRYMSLKVIPDIVYKRFGLKSGRFFEMSRRIYLKTLWWYIHLSWQGSINDTKNILLNNTTDTIVQLVERVGTNGYRIDYCRRVMAEFHRNSVFQPGNKTILFRKVMKLSTARLKSVEPSLYEGGNEAFAKGLFDYFVKTS